MPFANYTSKNKIEDTEKAKVLNEIIAINPPLGSVNNHPEVPPITLNVPDTGYPPQYSPPHEPYLSEPLRINTPDVIGYPTYDQTNYVATGSKPNSQPSMHNEEGWSANKEPPISTQGLNIDPHSILFEPPMNETKFSDKIDKQRDKYLHPNGEKPAADVRIVKDETSSPEIHIHLDMADPDEFKFDETIDDGWREVVSSPRFEAFTNSSSFVGNVRYDRDTNQMTMILNGKEYDFCDVPERKFDSLKGSTSMGKAFNDTIKGQHDCGGTRLNLPRTNSPIQESIGQIRNQFDWLSDEYLDRVKKINSDGKWYLIRAAAETITNHMSEGEEYRRKLDGDELHAMARTAINHTMDINHLGENFKTEALVADSEYDKKRKEIQMLVHESDPEIIDAISNHDITAVSINGGAPRDTKVECGYRMFQCAKRRGAS